MFRLNNVLNQFLEGMDKVPSVTQSECVVQGAGGPAMHYTTLIIPYWDKMAPAA
jgi:hypothetical protein